ncbi:MAG: hypothetical protein CEE43_19765 [Promethearchaeota archaeon Loki_b32]|nr:MAG: hypothetical protein CEE43_19765 [Candidatus Lokiarchaeota archaeon Loki_b32]
MTTIKKKIKKSNKKRILFNQKGMALITTLIFIFILVTFVVALLTMTSNDSRLSTLQRESTRAFYFADAGIEETFWKLNTAVEDGGEEMLTWRPTDEPDPGTATEYYQITIVNIGVDDPTEDPPTKETDEIKITSTGVVEGGKFSSGRRTIEVTAEIDFLITSKYVYAILADKIILFQGTPGPEINGDVHSNDDILVSGQFDENYDGIGTSSGDTNDLDDTLTGVPTKTIPTIDYADLKAKSDLLGNTISGDKILGNGESWGTVDNPLTGIHYIEGSLEAKQGSEIYVENGAIIATGSVDIKEGSYMEHTRLPGYLDPDDYSTGLAVIAQGDIRIFAKGSVINGVVQSILPDGTCEGYIELKNGCTVEGSVIADTVYVRNKCSVTYDEELSQITSKGDGFYKKTSWREIY